MLLAILPIEDIWGLSRLCKRLSISILRTGTKLDTFLFDPNNSVVQINGLEIRLDKIHGCLFLPLNFEPPFFDVLTTDATDHLAKLQLAKVNQFLLHFLDSNVRCLNPPLRASFFSNKAIFLQLLKDASVPCPDTIVTNEVSAIVNRFSPFGTVSKVLSSHNHSADGIALPASFFAISEILANATLVSETPLVYQSYHACDREYRTFHVCGQLITVEVQRPASCEVVDFRFRSGNNATYAITDDVTYRTEIAEYCKRLFKASQLPFFCIDWLVVDRRPVVIDFNPHGSWYWMPSSVCDPISQFFVRHVESYLLEYS